MWNISATTGQILPKFQTEAYLTKPNITHDENEMTSNGRQPQNIESGVSKQPLIGSSSDVEFKLRGPN